MSFCVSFPQPQPNNAKLRLLVKQYIPIVKKKTNKPFSLEGWECFCIFKTLDFHFVCALPALIGGDSRLTMMMILHILHPPSSPPPPPPPSPPPLI